jgi:hypothetical protein
MKNFCKKIGEFVLIGIEVMGNALVWVLLLLE